jgi:hypothetical protein
LTGDLPLGAYNDTITNDVDADDENARAGTPIFVLDAPSGENIVLIGVSGFQKNSLLRV